MKHYYSIANFMVGTFTNILNKFFYTETNQTYQQLLGEMTAWSQGNNTKYLFNNNTIPQHFVDSWGADLARNIANEFINQIINLEDPSDGWNGDLLHTTPLSLPQLIMDWSTVTTIGAGILDTIDYYTNYTLLSWSSPIGLPNIIRKNAKQNYEELSLNNVLGGTSIEAVLGAARYTAEIFKTSVLDIQRILSSNYLYIIVIKYGIDSIKPLHEAGADFSKFALWEIAELVNKYGIDSIKPLHEVGINFSKLVRILVNKCGFDSIKFLHETGADFSKSAPWEIEELVNKCGIDLIKPLHEAGTDFSKLAPWEIEELVNNHGIDLIKPLHEAGINFSKLDNYDIRALVQKHGIEIKDKLLHPENIKDKTIADEILIESQKHNSLIQEENIYYDTAEEIETNNTTDTYDTLEGN